MPFFTWWKNRRAVKVVQKDPNYKTQAALEREKEREDRIKSEENLRIACEEMLKKTIEMIKITEDPLLDDVIARQEHYLQSAGGYARISEHEELEAMLAERTRRKMFRLSEGARMYELTDKELLEIIDTPVPEVHSPDLAISKEKATEQIILLASVASMRATVNSTN